MTDSRPEHEPVLVEPLLRLVTPQPGEVVLDGTAGLGGHARHFIPATQPDGRYIGLDLDETMLGAARRNLAEYSSAGVTLEKANYAEFPEVLRAQGLQRVDVLFLDLGVNSAQLADEVRGFSFDRDGPLDMRYDRSQERQALDLVNAMSETDLADLFYQFGQEGLSRKIAKRICQVRHEGRITTTRVLANAVESAVTVAGERARGKVHPATRVFQALRVAVNRELDNLQTFLDQALAWLSPRGRLAIISFHSLEDGIVKRYLRAHKADYEDLTRRPVVADQQERRRNPRSRSAKLRVARRRTPEGLGRAR